MENGTKKILIAVIITSCVTGGLTLISYVVANDANSRARDTKITENYKESDRRMTERNTEAFNGQMKATNDLKVTVGSLDTSVKFMGKQLEKIANGQ